jgi:hypothetical protein
MIPAACRCTCMSDNQNQEVGALRTCRALRSNTTSPHAARLCTEQATWTAHKRNSTCTHSANPTETCAALSRNTSCCACSAQSQHGTEGSRLTTHSHVKGSTSTPLAACFHMHDASPSRDSHDPTQRHTRLCRECERE